MLVAVASVGYAVAVPKEGESFTEFYLLTEGEDGELVADGYPTEFVRGEGQPLVVGVGNNGTRADDVHGGGPVTGRRRRRQTRRDARA